MQETKSKPSMVKVCLSGSVTPLRDWSPYLRKHPSCWSALRAGQVVDFPPSQVALMKGSIKLAPEPKPVAASTVKPLIVKEEKTEEKPVFVAEEKSSKKEKLPEESPSTDEVISSKKTSSTHLTSKKE